MIEERYPGEHRALSLFLSDLRTVVVDRLGRDSLLFHRLDRALRRGDLEALRSGRSAFLAQPESVRQELVQAMLVQGAPAAPTRSALLERYRREEASAFVRFEVDEIWPDGEPQIAVTLDHELMQDRPVRVLISPGTLPGVAAQALRAIADRIEADRRLLSDRHWRHRSSLEPDALHPRAHVPD